MCTKVNGKIPACKLYQKRYYCCLSLEKVEEEKKSEIKKWNIIIKNITTTGNAIRFSKNLKYQV